MNGYKFRKMKSNSEKCYTLITGASAGLGKQIALESAKQGFNLFLVSLPGTGLEDFSEELKKEFPVKITCLSIDLTKEKSPQKVYDFAVENKITVNMLINNAGLGFGGRLENLTSELIDTMVLLNVRASTLLIYLFLSEMKKLEKAYILNISSFGGLAPLPYKSVYAATKTYLLFFTQALHEELKDTNIFVSSIHPNGIKSERALPKIKKSGFIARASALSTEYVARAAIKNLLAGNKFVIPGMINKIYYLIGIIIPHGLILKITGIVFRKNA